MKEIKLEIQSRILDPLKERKMTQNIQLEACNWYYKVILTEKAMTNC